MNKKKSLKAFKAIFTISNNPHEVTISIVIEREPFSIMESLTIKFLIDLWKTNKEKIIITSMRYRLNGQYQS